MLSSKLKNTIGLRFHLIPSILFFLSFPWLWPWTMKSDWFLPITHWVCRRRTLHRRFVVKHAKIAIFNRRFRLCVFGLCGISFDSHALTSWNGLRRASTTKIYAFNRKWCDVLRFNLLPSSRRRVFRERSANISNIISQIISSLAQCRV